MDESVPYSEGPRRLPESPAGGAGWSEEDLSADLFDFVDDFERDEAKGAVKELREYLARYPRAQGAVAAEYLRLTGAIEESKPDLLGSSRTDAPSDSQERIGRYRLLRVLGQGGQGEVWLARDDGLQRDVALKLLGARFVTEDRRARFRREAESIARLDHPGVAQVYEADIEAEQPFIAMRFVEGVDLGAVIAGELAASEEERPRVGSALPVRPGSRSEVVRVLRFFEKAARALHAAHVAEVVHRDVKPGNIMVTGEGVPVLLDFGLARDDAGQDGERGGSLLTREGDVFGTLAYMAPEQLRGNVEQVDARADVWALGVTMFEVLTGERPFEGQGPAALAIAIDQGQAKSLRMLNRAVPQDAVTVTETALEPQIERRYASALDLAEDLRRICEYEPIQATPAGALLRLRRWCRREPGWAVTIFGTLMALVVGLIASQAALEQIQDQLDRYKSLIKVTKIHGLAATSVSGALALGLEAHALDDTPTTRSMLLRPLLDLSLEARFSLGSDRAWDAAFLPGTGPAGGTVAIVGPRDRVSLASIGQRRVLAQVGVGDAAFEAASVPGGMGLLVGTEGGRVLGLDGGSLETLFELSVAPGAVTELVVPTESLAAALVGQQRVVLFHPTDGTLLGSRDLGEFGTFGALKAVTIGEEVRFVASSYDFHGDHTKSSSRFVVVVNPQVEGAPIVLEHAAPVVDLCAASEAGVALSIDREGVVRGIDLWAGGWLAGAAEGVVARLGEPGSAVAVDAAGRRFIAGVDGRARRRADGEPGFTLRAYELENGRAEPLWSRSSGTRIADIAFRPGHDQVAHVAWLGDLAVRDPESGEILVSHRELAVPKELKWSEGGHWLVGIGNLTKLDVWRGGPAAGAHRLLPPWGTVDAPLVDGALIPEVERVALWDRSGRGAILESPMDESSDAAPGATVARFGEGREGAGLVSISSGAPVLFSVGEGLSLERVACATGKITHRESDALTGSQGCPTWIGASAQGNALWALMASGALWRWSAELGWERVSLTGAAAAADVIAGGGLLVATEGGGLVTVTRRAEGFVEDRLPWPPELESALSAVAVSPDGKRAVCVSGSGSTLWLWDLAGRARLGQVGAPRGRLRACWSGNGGVLVAPSGRGVPPRFISLAGPLPKAGDAAAWRARWSTPSVKQLDELTAVRGARDGGLACTAWTDGTVQVWDSNTGTVLIEPAPFHAPDAGADRDAPQVLAVDLAGVGGQTRVLAVSAAGAAVWPLDVVTLARKRAPRMLSLPERMQVDVEER